MLPVCPFAAISRYAQPARLHGKAVSVNKIDRVRPVRPVDRAKTADSQGKEQL